MPPDTLESLGAKHPQLMYVYHNSEIPPFLFNIDPACGVSYFANFTPAFSNDLPINLLWTVGNFLPSETKLVKRYHEQKKQSRRPCEYISFRNTKP